MYNILPELKKEHAKMRKIFRQINRMLSDGTANMFIVNKFSRLGNLWNKHEQKEEKFFENLGVSKKNEQPFYKMYIDEHRELKGHWLVLEECLNSGDELKMRIAIETDGMMLIDKLKKHMDEEDKFFEKVEKKYAKIVEVKSS